MTKATIKAVIAGLLLTVAIPVLAQNNDGQDRSVTDVGSELAISQNINSQGDIRCDSVADDQFEELGDAVMQAMVGDDQVHEVMDNMMGSEESESLRSMHIAIGQRYLGCAQGQFGTMGRMGGMMSMMGNGWQRGDGFMVNNSYGPWGMMSGSWGIGMLPFWIIVIIGIVLLVKWLNGQRHSQLEEKSALDILKKRYAKGEIDKQEFKDKKKDLL